jgi:phosphate transport system protein
MSIHLQRDLDSLEREILSQSAMVEGMIVRSCQVIWDLRPRLAQSIFEVEQVVNQREVHIEEECLKTLALHQPVAIDLRRIATVLKINGELERIGDLSVNIVESARIVAESGTLEPPASMRRLAEIARDMVRKAMRSFVSLDVDAARTVCLTDDEADQLYAEVIQQMEQAAAARPENVRAAFCILFAARDLERIADHATNIAQDVIYLAEGEIARHYPQTHDGAASEPTG